MLATKELYPRIGEMFWTTANKVERGIRYSIENSMYSGMRNTECIYTIALELNYERNEQ